MPSARDDPEATAMQSCNGRQGSLGVRSDQVPVAAATVGAFLALMILAENTGMLAYAA